MAITKLVNTRLPNKTGQQSCMHGNCAGIKPLTHWDRGLVLPLIARFMGPTWGPSGADRTQVGPILSPWILQSGTTTMWRCRKTCSQWERSFRWKLLCYWLKALIRITDDPIYWRMYASSGIRELNFRLRQVYALPDPMLPNDIRPSVNTALTRKKIFSSRFSNHLFRLIFWW